MVKLTNAHADSGGNIAPVFCQGSVGQIAKHQDGSILDFREYDQSDPVYLDLYSVTMTSYEQVDSIHIVLIIDAPFPEDENIKATYRFFFDTDHLTQTGNTVGSSSGFDRELRIDVQGNQALAPLDVAGEIINYRTDEHIALLPPPQLSHQEVFDVGDPPPVVGEMIDIELSRQHLNLRADQIPILITSEEEGKIIEELLLIFDQKYYETLTVFSFLGSGRSGEPISFTGKKFSPNTKFRVELNDEELSKGISESDGRFEGHFLLPQIEAGLYRVFVIPENGDGNIASAFLTCQNPEK